MTTDESVNPWTTLASRAVYDNAWIRVSEFDVVNPSGGRGIYGVVHFKNLAIGAIPYESGEVWLVGQYRYPLRRYSWEIPEGGGKLFDDPLASAKRELREETGLSAGRWDKILTLHLSNSVSDEEAHIFLARDLVSGAAAPEETEALAVQKITLKNALRLIQEGKITDSLTVAGLLQLYYLENEGLMP
jgi:8-oxo-dGTP pyrophosphatase MutT (NUDIX family)